ncbi:MAG TPA: hypothetical protein VMW27_26255 [Thermoanaerobaculia bacterium]|nr:hypothetical protein [Thermoanaerobaculia bacterium]
MNNLKKSWLTIAGICLGFMLSAQAAPADDSALRDLTAEWWQWAFSIPTSENPMLDATGEKCVVGQRGSTWFLAGTYGGGAITRTCSVPAGTRIFFPVANYSFFDSPGVCQGPESFSVAEMRAAIADFIDGVTGISVELDGAPVRRVRRVRSRVFEIALPEVNVLDAPCAADGGMPAGIYSPTVDDGYYVLLDSLAVGEHTLRFHAEQADAGFVIDTTYHLTVVPVARR